MIYSVLHIYGDLILDISCSPADAVVPSSLVLVVVAHRSTSFYKPDLKVFFKKIFNFVHALYVVLVYVELWICKLRCGSCNDFE
jgi:hypothetical protein